MANFDNALQTLLGIEGKYSNDLDDAGGETYCGISRQYHPYWPGWILVDARRSDPSFPGCLNQEERLYLEVRIFYQEQYWVSFWGDGMASDELAERMLDIAVNLGAMKAVEFLQQALNVLNRNEVLYADILVDGIYGPVTSETLNECVYKVDLEYLLKTILIFQGKHYLDYMRRSPIQEKFARGWLNRLRMEVL